jgi:two-component system, sensor histidine kinase PdtaS
MLLRTLMHQLMTMCKKYFILILLFGYNFLIAQESYSRHYLHQISEKKPLSKYDSLMVNGAIFSLKDTAKAQAFFKEAIDLAMQEGDLMKRVLTNIAIGEMYIEYDAVRKAYNYFFRARNLRGDFVPDYEGGLASFGIARTQYLGGNYNTSTLNFLATIYAAQTIKNKSLESEATEYLGLIYSNFQDYNQSINYYRKCFDLKKSLNDDKSCLRIAEKLGDIYYSNHRYDSAFYFAHLSVQLAETMQLPNDIAIARLNKAAILIRLKKLNDANDELRYFSKIGQNTVEARNSDKFVEGVRVRYQTIQGNYWLQKGDKKTALFHYDSAIAVGTKRALPELYSVVYRNMAESFYDLKDYKTAYDFYQKYATHTKNLTSGNKSLNLESVQMYFDVNATKDEIKLLNNENKLQELQLANEATKRKSLETENLLKDSIILRGHELQASLNREYQLQQAKLKDERNLGLSLMFGLSTALLLGGLIFYQFQKQKKKNAIIKKQADELETLMKEIHHRVKNNLQVISSLLDLQSLTIKDEKAAYAVKEGKNRVQSMALIHQNLYNEGNIKGIRMEDYIQNLAKNLFDSYNIKPEKIKLITDIDPLNLDVDTVIPIGLTLNELISNSLKYAFNHQDLGEITVILKQDGNDILLKVKDNGNGFKENYDHQSTSFGFKMIRAFAQKLKAKLEIYNDNGACVEMHITKYKTA